MRSRAPAARVKPTIDGRAPRRSQGVMMNRLALILALSGTALLGHSSATRAAPSAATLAMLDPIRAAGAICGSQRGASLLRDRLRVAAAYGKRTETGPIPLFDGVPRNALPAASSNARAQRYFDQGVMLIYGFNHAGAIRSFRAAQALDPDCALCFWGEAIAHGPNINAPMEASDRRPALAAAAKAVALRDKASPEAQALIDAIALRYSPDAEPDRAALDAAFARAMAAAAARFPANDDIAVIAAEALMDTSPWNYWEADGKTPRAPAAAAIALVEAVLARNPRHAQAAHLYIHLMEASRDPERAEQAADWLVKDAPPAGHLLHMPGHIYYRIGRYADSMRANVAAVQSDIDYFERAGDNGLFRYGYYPHDVHFLVTSAQLAGDMKTAIRESERLASILDPDIATQIGWIQVIHAAPFFAEAQFAAPEEVLAMAPSSLPYVEAMRRYARATARATQHDRAGFEAEMGALRSIAADTDWAALEGQGIPARQLLGIAENVAKGRMAYAGGDYAAAIAAYRTAADGQAALHYMEPPLWYYPVEQSLGAAYFAAGRYDEARAAFQAALTIAPVNGWALYGLAKTEAALGHTIEAAAAEAALDRVWLGDRAWLSMARL